MVSIQNVSLIFAEKYPIEFKSAIKKVSDLFIASVSNFGGLYTFCHNGYDLNLTFKLSSSWFCKRVSSSCLSEALWVPSTLIIVLNTNGASLGYFFTPVTTAQLDNKRGS